MGRIAFLWYVSLNMLVCAVLFAPWALPRETVSGLLGRYAPTNRLAQLGAWVVDRIYYWHPAHCWDIARIEAEARKVLYP